MRPRLHFAAFVIALVGCKRSSTVTATAAPEDGSIDPPAPVVVPPTLPLFVAEGRSFALDPPRVVQVFETARIVKQASIGDRAYVVLLGDVLEAFDARTGVRAWSIAAKCDVLEAFDAGAICAAGDTLWLFAAKDGVGMSAPPTVSGSRIDAIVRYHNRALLIRDAGVIESFDASTLSRIGGSTVPFAPYRHVAANEKGMCVASEHGMGLIDASCVDGDGAVRWTKSIAVNGPLDPTTTRYYVHVLDDRWLVAGTDSFFGTATVHHGVVVRLDDGVEVMRVDEEIRAAITAENGALEGALALQPELHLVEPTGTIRWSHPTLPAHYDAAHAIVIGGQLAIESNCRMATGAVLLGLDLATGATRWTGDVELLPIAHSKYSNHVDLTRVGDFLVMHGQESGQRYVEVFASSGARVLAEVH